MKSIKDTFFIVLMGIALLSVMTYVYSGNTIAQANAEKELEDSIWFEFNESLQREAEYTILHPS